MLKARYTSRSTYKPTTSYKKTYVARYNTYKPTTYVRTGSGSRTTVVYTPSKTAVVVRPGYRAIPYYRYVNGVRVVSYRYVRITSAGGPGVIGGAIAGFIICLICVCIICYMVGLGRDDHSVEEVVVEEVIVVDDKF